MEKIILASSSPRRKELLNKYNLDFHIFPADVDESYGDDELPEQIAMSLALQKALWVEKHFKEEIIIAADTIVVLEDEILNKPIDEKHAFHMLKKLSGKEHRVITGISIIKANTNLKVIDFETTIVKFRNISDDKIKRYIKTKEPMDKAGAYGIQGYGQVLIEGLNGCYSNVVGLPLGKLDYLLSKFFNLKIL
ncbi:MAG TPA: Maf family protein [Tissierellaceae bacterium]|nr:Maf family protein [Tissierellaceae bacterium]